MGAAGQDVTTGSGAVTIDTGSLADITDAVLDGSAATTSLTINLAANTDISGATITGTLGSQDANYAVTLASGVDAEMTSAQNALISAATDANTVTLSDNGAATGHADVEAYVLADGGATFDMGADQSVTGGSGDDIISTNSQATISGTLSGGSAGNDTLRVNGADVDFTGVTLTSIETIDFNAGTIAATFDQADISGMTVTETGSNGTVKINSTTGSTTNFDVAQDIALDLSNIASGVDIVFMDDQGTPASTTNVNLLSGSTLTLNATDLSGLTITESASATVNVKSFEAGTTLANVTATNLAAYMDVTGTLALTGDINSAALNVVTAGSTPILNLRSASNVDGSLNLGGTNLEVLLTSTQHDALSFAGTAGQVQINVQNSTGGDDAIDQETGISTYVLDSNSSSNNTITMNLLGTDGGVNITGNTDAALTLAAGSSNTFSGTWSTFDAGDTLAVSGSTISVDVSSVSSGTSLGGIDTITVATGDALSANAAQLDSATASGLGSISVKSLGSAAADLSTINTTSIALDVTSGSAEVASAFALKAARAYSVEGGNNLSLTGATSIGLDSSSSFAIASGTSLTVKSSQMDEVATSGSGTTIVNDFASSAADLSELNSTAVTLVGSGSETVGAEFTLAGRAYTIDGSSATLDLSAATLNTAANYTINSTNTVKFTAAQLDGATAGGAGAVYISALHSTTAADLDAITSSGGVEIALGADTTMTSAATIGATDLTISAASASILDLSSISTSNFNLSSNSVAVGANVTLELTADQAAIPTGFSGDGDITITSGTIDAALANTLSGSINGTLVLSDLTQIDGKASDIVTMLADNTITKPGEFSSVIAAEAASAVTTAANLNTINVNNSNGTISFATGITVQDTAANLGNVIGDSTISFANNVSIIATDDVTPVLADDIFNTITGSGTKTYSVAMGVSDINNAVQASLAAANTVTITGSIGPDLINLAAFNLGNTTINSGGFGDTIYASAGSEAINSEAGDDTIYSFGANTITTGTGSDTIAYLSSSSFGDTITDLSSSDKIDYDNANGSLSYLSIDGTAGVTFQSVAQNDTINGGTTVVELEGTLNSSGDESGLVTALGSTATNSDFASGDTLVIVSYQSGNKAHVFEFTDANGADIDVSELSLIATLTNVTADTLTADNFI